MLLWSWDNNPTAGLSLGIPVTQSLAMGRLEKLLVSRIEQHILKLRDCLLTLAAQITVADCLILGCVWYLLIM